MTATGSAEAAGVDAAGVTVTALPLPAPAGVFAGPRCRPAVADAVRTGGVVLLVCRASSSRGAQALDLAVQTAGKAARHLRLREDLWCEHVLPPPAALKQHCRSRKISERREQLGGGSIDHQYVVWDDRAHGLLVLITTGTGTQISTTYDQPAIFRVADMIMTQQPAVVWANELTRIGRGYFGPIVEVVQHLSRQSPPGPLVGDEDLELGQLDQGRELTFAVKGITGKYAARATTFATHSGMRHRTGQAHPQLPGVWSYGSNLAPPPGLTTLHLWSDDGDLSRAHNHLVLDCPQARPPAARLAGGAVPAVDATGAPADQVGLIRWLGRHLFTDGWGARECAGYLAEHGWSTPGMRRGSRGPHAPTLQLKNGYAGRNDGRRALQAFLRHLDFYQSGTLRVAMPDGGDPVVIRGVLPLDGQPWLTAPQVARIRRGLPARDRGTARRHLFAGLPAVVHGEQVTLAARGRGGQVRYYLRRRGDVRRPLASSRAQALPPLPATVLAQWYLAALTDMAGPLSLHLAADAPHSSPDPARASVLALTGQVQELEARVAGLRHQLLEGRLEPRSASFEFLTTGYDTAVAELQASRADLAAAESLVAQHATFAPERGLPLTELTRVAGALTHPTDTGVRRMLRDATESFTLSYRRRPGPGRLPAYDITAELVLLLRDERETWRHVYCGTHLAGAVHRAPDKLAAALTGLYAGTPLPQTLGVDWQAWLPAVRTALGCPGPFHLAWVDEHRLLRVGMAVLHPRRRDVPAPAGPEDIVRIADPALDPAALPALARRLHEPVALLRAIHRAFAAEPMRQARWLHNRSPRVAACYAAAAQTGGLLRREALPPNLRARMHDRLGAHRLAGEWTAPGDGCAVLAPCRWCGSARRMLLLPRPVTGSVCLDCRTDRAGVVWDERYDRYADRAAAPLGVAAPR